MAFGRTFGQVKPAVKESNDCEVRLKRDKSGRVVGKKISGSCSPAQIKALGGIVEDIS